MSDYTVSQKIAIINDIDQESRELWLILNDKGAADLYSQDQIKELFINILSKDKDQYTRFNIQRSESYIEDAIADNDEDRADDKPIRNFDLLSVCYSVTRKNNLHNFLFDLDE